ncbi:MAG: hypothetical protein JXA82_08585 [Sedimentisphaerales bacterium]|nr:hypothetical protein [Sedimentisphaerales bacterium]
MQPRSKVDHMLFLVIVGLLAWAVPGGGHFLIGERKRSIIIFITITATFVSGLYVGSIGVIDPVNAKPWYMAQILASPAVGILANVTRSGQYAAYGRPGDVGQIYTSIAGMLNLLCILSAMYMAYQGRGEKIGEEEDES